jgi:hypothetical protein
MLIHPTLSSETAVPDLRSSRAADSSLAPAGAAPATPGPDPATARLQELALLDADGVSPIADTAGADQVTAFFRANLFTQYGTALAAQANLNPDSVYNLLQ